MNPVGTPSPADVKRWAVPATPAPLPPGMPTVEVVAAADHDARVAAHAARIAEHVALTKLLADKSHFGRGTVVLSRAERDALIALLSKGPP